MRYSAGICLWELKKTREDLRLASVRAEIRTESLQNESLEHHRYTNPLGNTGYRANVKRL
jgi:hypothetical protein